MTAAEAVRLIKTGDRVSIANAAGEPSFVIDAMVENREEYRDVEITHMFPIGKCQFAQKGMERYFRLNSTFVGGPTRETVRSGHGDFTPCYFSQIPNLYDRTLPLDVALLQMSPPDIHGYCSCGVSVDYTRKSAQTAKVVIAQVNSNMPRTLGDSFVHVSKLTAIVEHDAPLIELPPPKITEVERAIGENCAKLINDGDCLQLGIGAIPDAVLLFLREKKDLGIHSEMFSDGVVELAESGVINHSRKNFMPGKAVATFLMGTRRLYDFVHDNPSVHMAPSTWVNDPFVAGSNDNLVSVNSCVQVDLLGQVSSETVGFTQISAVGGQVDFVRAAAISKGGRSIIAMASTAAGGTISKIVSILDEGMAVTTGRCDVEYIITEHGVANLKYRTMRDRARMLIDIAHPKFRDELKEGFERRFKVKYSGGVSVHMGAWPQRPLI
ncbi:MAG: 4-hydroxybutyrate CoA-transferase [Deltaproteobacteria bacterium]|jgi:4-hydroxybutyrate CoA-transferase|nr:4-hydroxybutyrate CoA-transferase [Deltaproteobacteria bacterium]